MILLVLTLYLFKLYTDVTASSCPALIGRSFDSMRQKNVSKQCWNNETYAVYSFCGLKHVDDITLPSTTEYLLLMNNSITVLQDDGFLLYTVLKILDLSNNLIKTIQPLAFNGLSNLTHLNLRGNPLVMMETTFHENVFSPLQSLTWLKLNMINTTFYTSRYPDKSLSRLRKLEVLFLDGVFEQPFGPGFQNMTSLTNLTVAGYFEGQCYIHTLTNKTFIYLTNLKYLNLSSCFIKGRNIHHDAFLPLKNLVTLDLTHNEDIDIPYFNRVLHGIKNTTSLKFLRMNLIVNRYSLGICLESSYFNHFPPNLEYLEAQENNVEAVDRDFIQRLPKTLKTLDLSGNRFVFGTYLQDLSKLENLTVLKLNKAGFTYGIPKRYPYELFYSMSTKKCTLYNQTYTDNEDIIFALPPNLNRLEMNGANLNYELSKLVVQKNKLEYLSITDNHFSKLRGPLQGFHHLKYLDISFCFVSHINHNFFINLTSLQVLNMSSNLLGYYFNGRNSSRVFSSLSNLQFLNLSFNSITSLPNDVFSQLTNLRKLYLDTNPLYAFDVDVSGMKKLEYLSLKYTRIETIAPYLRDYINSLLAQNVTFRMSLSCAPITCNCENFDFLKWMTTSGAFRTKFEENICINPNDHSIKYIKDGYNATMAILKRQCEDHIILFLLVSGSVVLIFSLIIFTLVYRYRWRIRYLYYAAYLQYKKSKKETQIKFEFDAFISYDHKDHNFVVNKLYPELKKRGLNVFIHGRDFVAGDYIASNIVKAVCTCRKTVVVLTRNMINSYWCGYEIQMANIESIHTGRPVLIFLLMEKIPKNDLGRELLYNIRNNTYIPYPDPLPDATSIGRLWDKLAYDIRN